MTKPCAPEEESQTSVIQAAARKDRATNARRRRPLVLQRFSVSVALGKLLICSSFPRVPGFVGALYHHYHHPCVPTKRQFRFEQSFTEGMTVKALTACPVPMVPT
ncbi:hypothetical protein FGB62_198g09 [Gracilaria domingensis]|nr:hypothetical protein FGB62_198g09 [Gracilaria domingensis]